MSSVAPSRRSGVAASIAVRISSFAITMSSADVATEPTAIAFIRTRGARSCAASSV